MSEKPSVPGRMIRLTGLATHVVAEPGPAGVPPVVLSSGLGGAWYDWERVVPLLSGAAPLLRFDRPGLGWSEPSPVAPSLAGEAERIRALLTMPGVLAPAAPPIGPAILVGHSLAGFHVEAFARLHPELTAGLVLVDASAEPDIHAPDPSEVADRKLALWQSLGELAARTGAARIATPALRSLVIRLSRADGADLADRADVAATAASGRLLTAALLENATYDAEAAALLELRCERPFPQDPPLRVIAAFGTPSILRSMPLTSARQRRQNAVWLARQRQLAEMSVRAKLIELADSAHFVPYDRPDTIAEAVREILSALD